jgi:hypothetical protein
MAADQFREGRRVYSMAEDVANSLTILILKRPPQAGEKKTELSALFQMDLTGDLEEKTSALVEMLRSIS